MTTFRKPSFPPRGPRGPRRFPPQDLDPHRINFRITAREVRVIGPEGEQLGVLQTQQAIKIAQEQELDLVEVAPQAQPPVCRILDYGKFKYKEQKKEAEAKKKRTEIELKELRIRYRTDVGDLEIKLKHAREFLSEGNKVKFTMRFRGREGMYKNLGIEKLKEIEKRLADIATVDDRSGDRGNQLHVTFTPVKK